MSLKNFCILPFMHLATTTEGNCRLCCKVSRHDVIKDDNGVPFNVNTHSVDQIWNSQHYKNVRQRMLKDERLPECKICFDEEDTFYSKWQKGNAKDLPSKRRKENQKWLHVEKTKIKDEWNNIINSPSIRYYDIRLSNLCNLKCRMCWPNFSSQIVKEQKEFASQGLPTWYKDYDVPEWSSKNIMQGISENLIAIEEITFVGGEPTLHDDMYQLLTKLVNAEVSKNIRLKLTSNLTNIQQRFLDMIPLFKDVVINGSIDGVNTTNEYIRYPSNWSAIEKNINKILAIPEVHLNLTPVIQIYNIFNIFDMTHWYMEKWIDTQKGPKFTLNYDLLYDPNYLSIKMLNNKGKHKWYENYYTPTIEYLDDIIDNVDTMNETVSNYWRVILTLRKRIVNIALYAEVLGFDKDKGKWLYWFKDTQQNELTEKLHAYTYQLDNHRKQNIKDLIPDFNEMTL